MRFLIRGVGTIAIVTATILPFLVREFLVRALLVTDFVKNGGDEVQDAAYIISKSLLISAGSFTE